MAYRTLAFVVLYRIAEEYFVEFEEAVQFIAVEAEEIGGFVFGVAMGDSGLARVADLLPRGVWSSLIPLPIGGAEPVSLAGCRGIAILLHSTMLRIGIFLILLAASAAAQTASFGPPLAMPLLKGPLAMVSGDFNGDGHADFAAVNSSVREISIFLGAGDGTFTQVAAVALPSDCAAAFLAVGPFAAAGKADLLAVCALGNLVVLPNTGGGTFGKAVETVLPNPAWVGDLMLGELSPAIADFNGDGHPDLMIGTLNQQTFAANWYYLAGQGGGAFGTPVALNLGGVIPMSLVAGDFNGDGIPDLVAVQGVPPLNFQLLFGAGKGDGTFGTFISTPLPTSAGTILLPADVNGDGKLDLVIAGSALIPSFTSNTGASGVSVYLGDGKGNFASSFNTTQTFFMSGAVLGNFLGTGKLDLVGATVDGNFLLGAIAVGGLQLFPGVGDGTFGKAVTIPSPSFVIPTGVVAADFNEDGRPDLALATLPAQAVGNSGPVSLSTDFSALLKQVLAVLPSGTAKVMLNTTAAAALTFNDANGASFANGAQAAGAIVSAFRNGATDFTGVTAEASTTPLPETLGGVSIDVKDLKGVTRAAPLFYVSPQQINYAIPAETSMGAATVTIHAGASVFSLAQSIVAVAPGLFNAGGLAAGTAVTTVNGVQQSTPLQQNGALVPVDVSGGETFLVLYGTGIRNHATAVTATVGTTQIAAAFAGAQGVYTGEDQVNIQLPASLKGAGTVGVWLMVDGQRSAPVKVSIQ